MAAAISRVRTRDGRVDLALLREIQDGRRAHSGPVEAFPTVRKARENGAKCCTKKNRARASAGGGAGHRTGWESLAESIHMILKTNFSNINPITLNASALEEVQFFTYLGNIIDQQGGTDADVKARIGKARVPFIQLKNILDSRELTLTTKFRLFNSNV
ncbi:Hypothetical predicted protein [Pelobates cultripes]|uniref:DUF6451 domain-containing protein n=1 Tax=Pelobates cultripes TaxID=61616 RepID=A0AAD1S4A6_PELCU|nr:Hypothetical predicted protein [Pelobates cultripes]